MPYGDGNALILRTSAIMSAVTISNLSDEADRAFKLRTARHGRSAEARKCDIRETAVRPSNRLRLGSALTEMSRKMV